MRKTAFEPAASFAFVVPAPAYVAPVTEPVSVYPGAEIRTGQDCHERLEHTSLNLRLELK